jgi:hypothetical protein
VLAVARRIEMFLAGSGDLEIPDDMAIPAAGSEVVLFDPDYAFAVFLVIGRSPRGVAIGPPVRGPFYPPRRLRRVAKS